jgi:hypothetical protein
MRKSDVTSANTCIRLNCDSFCAKCVGDNLCDSCVSSNYYLQVISVNERSCKEKTKVEGTFRALSNPKIFELKFSASWDDFFRDFENNTEVKISKMDSSNYNCIISRELPAFSLKCSYYQNVTSESVISLKIKNYPQNTDKSSHYLLKDYFEVPLEPYIFCGEGSAWRESEYNKF